MPPYPLQKAQPATFTCALRINAALFTPLLTQRALLPRHSKHYPPHAHSLHAGSFLIHCAPLITLNVTGAPCVIYHHICFFLATFCNVYA